MAFHDILKFTMFRNTDRFDGSAPLERGKPNFSNGKVTIETDIPAGVYSISGWQYADSLNLGVPLSKKTDEPIMMPAEAPPSSEQVSVEDDFA